MITDRSREMWLRRKQSIRQRIRGTSERPRLTVFKSAKHTYAQVIDDSQGVTLTTASTLEKDLREALEKKKKNEAAALIGALLAERCLSKGITQVVFDRNGYPYHGRVAKLADAAREKGLTF